MSTPSSLKSHSAIRLRAHYAIATPYESDHPGPQCEEPVQGQEKGQDHLSNLQRLVGELLIKNQELRLALKSTMAQEKEERSWRPIR